MGDLSWGTHLCQFYHQHDDLVESVVPYLAAGLDQNEACLWILDEIMDIGKARELLAQRIRGYDKFARRGQIRVVSAQEWYFDPGFNGKKLIAKMEKVVEAVSLKKMDGVRVAGGIHKIARRQWDSWGAYEETVGRLLPGMKAMALCTYSLVNCPVTQISKVIPCHHKTFLKKGCSWEVVEK